MLGTWVMTNAAGKGDKWKLSQTEAQQVPAPTSPPNSTTIRRYAQATPNPVQVTSWMLAAALPIAQQEAQAAGSWL
ncbi:hypothetical protein NEUTE2DRAFT_64600 [Neurospora tetrasperma FGSC 2509]|nr:hypothetical protein NEUTE2DRAFT_64600 [Neurospora tetrasperma FGSC 2509]